MEKIINIVYNCSNLSETELTILISLLIMVKGQVLEIKQQKKQ